MNEETVWQKEENLVKDRPIEITLSQVGKEWSVTKISPEGKEWISGLSYFQALYRLNEAFVRLTHEPELK